MKNIAILSVLVALTGCASMYKPPSALPSATLSFDLTTDSVGTTGKHFSVWAYEDVKCTPSVHGKRLATKLYADSQEMLEPVRVIAGSPLTFAVLYGESRFAQNRGCSFTASFTPVAGRSYAVRFAVADQSLACGMQITDENGARVQYQAPEMSCAETMAGNVKNGGAGILNWEIKVVR